MRLVLALSLLTASAAACGQQTADDQGLARYVAADVKNDCLKARSQAPNAAFAHHLERLCDCMHAKIAATPMGRGDNDASVNKKVQAAGQACSAQLGGIADAEDYQATGIEPPATSPPR